MMFQSSPPVASMRKSLLRAAPMLAAGFALALLAACSHKSNAVGEAKFPVPANVAKGSPDVNSVPTEVPTPPDTKEQRADVLAGLVADRQNARHSDQPARTLPVAVRPLSDTPPAQTAELTTPPKPEAARAAVVARLETPPPTRPAEADGAAKGSGNSNTNSGSGDSAASTPAPAAQAQGPAPTRNAAAMIGPRPLQAAAQSSSGDEGDSVAQSALPVSYGEFRPLTDFDSTRNGLSHLMASIQIPSAGLTVSERSTLSEAALKQNQTHGVFRVIGRGSNPQAGRDKAITVCRELERLGVAADQIFAGFEVGNGPTEVFLHY